MAADFAGAINSGARVERGNRAQVSMDKRRTGDLVLFAFDLVFLDGESAAKLPPIEHKERLILLGRHQPIHVADDAHVNSAPPSDLTELSAIATSPSARGCPQAARPHGRPCQD